MSDINAIVGGPFRNEIVCHMDYDTYREANGLNPSSITEGIQGRGPELDRLSFATRYVKQAYEGASNGDSDQLVYGTYGHTLLLEPHLVNERYAFLPKVDKRTTQYKEAVNANPGKIILDERKSKVILSAVNQALDRKCIVDAMGSKGLSEVSVFSSEHGLQVKGRADRVNTERGAIVDVKFTNDIEASAFWSRCQSFRYYEKMACYRRWVCRELGLETMPCVFVVIQMNWQKMEATKLDEAVVPVEDGLLDARWKRCSRILELVAESIESGNWYGKDGGRDAYPAAIPYYEMTEEPDIFAGVEA